MDILLHALLPALGPEKRSNSLAPLSLITSAPELPGELLIPAVLAALYGPGPSKRPTTAQTVLVALAQPSAVYEAACRRRGVFLQDKPVAIVDGAANFSTIDALATDISSALAKLKTCQDSELPIVIFDSISPLEHLGMLRAKVRELVLEARVAACRGAVIVGSHVCCEPRDLSDPFLQDGGPLHCWLRHISRAQIVVSELPGGTSTDADGQAAIWPGGASGLFRESRVCARRVLLRFSDATVNALVV